MSNPIESIDEQFVSDYLKMLEDNGEPRPLRAMLIENILDCWLDTIDAPNGLGAKVYDNLKAQIDYYI